MAQLWGAQAERPRTGASRVRRPRGASSPRRARPAEGRGACRGRTAQVLGPRAEFYSTWRRTWHGGWGRGGTSSRSSKERDIGREKVDAKRKQILEVLPVPEKSKQRPRVYGARPDPPRRRGPPGSPRHVPLLPPAPRTARGEGLGTCQFASLAYAVLKDVGRNLACLA